MLLSQSVIGNSRSAAEQWKEVVRSRKAVNNQETAWAKQGLQTNAGLVPRDVYQEFDTQIVTRMRSDDGDVLLNALMPLSKSVSIGTLINKFSMASDAGAAQTSMTGQIGVKMDQVNYTYDGSLVPIHDTGFGRQWREWQGMTASGFDALIDDQRESVATLRRKIVNSLMNGHRDKDNNIITLDSTSWSGLRADSRVAQINIGAAGINFDFTDPLKTGPEIKAAFKQVRDVMWITNKAEIDLGYYVSREISSIWESEYSTNYAGQTIREVLAKLEGVASISTSSVLTGEEITGFPSNADKIRPVVGMGVNTVAMPRPVYNSNYEFASWGAIGFEVRNDFAGNTSVFFAQDLG